MSSFCPAQPAQVVLQRFEPLQEDPLVRFNAFIRGNLREFVISQIGDELSVPYHICLVAFLPMIFYSSVNVLGPEQLHAELNMIHAQGAFRNPAAGLPIGLGKCAHHATPLAVSKSIPPAHGILSMCETPNL